MTREQVGWNTSVLLHLLICGGFVLLNLGIVQTPRRVVIDLSFIAGEDVPSVAAPRTDDPPVPARQVAPMPEQPPVPQVQPDQELSAPLPEVSEPDPVDVVEPVPQRAVVASEETSRVPAENASPASEGADEGAREGPAEYVRAHFGYIRNLILHRLEYPALARRMGWSGRVVIAFTVCEDGSVEEARVVESSGRDLLDNNAIEVLARAAPFPPPPVPAEIIMPITYALN